MCYYSFLWVILCETIFSPYLRFMFSEWSCFKGFTLKFEWSTVFFITPDCTRVCLN
jgi:hypothetical protein